MKTLIQPIATPLTLAYAPDSQSVDENPPAFTWLPAGNSELQYVLRIESTTLPSPLLFSGIRQNFFRPDSLLQPGDYRWQYARWDDKQQCIDSEWSPLRYFTLPAGLPAVPALQHQQRYAHCNMAHPRLWLDPTALEAFSTQVAEQPAFCQWQDFVTQSVLPWLTHPLISEPEPYPQNQRTATLWRKMYIDCQEVLYAIRHLSIAGRVLHNEEMLACAQRWLLHVAAWHCDGPTSRDYNDEAAFRVLAALAWGYDWLHERLSVTERAEVRQALTKRLYQVVNHINQQAKIHHFPYESHGVRAISSAIVPGAIALLGEVEEAEKWLDAAINYYEGVYPPWGGNDGGWAEGTHYWMTAMAYFTEAANLLKAFTGHDLYRRPFFMRTGDFPLYTKAPSTRRASFGDDSTLGDLPCLKLGYLLRQFAGVTGNPYYQWYFEEICRNDPGTERAFYNYGWWDFNFDTLQYLHDYPQITAQPPTDLPPLRYFPHVGWAAIQIAPHDPHHHIQLVAKSSAYGSLSHSHADQNAFLLHAYGEDLAIQSGDYGSFGSSMHLNWRRQTRSKNVLLIDGQGQYGGRDAAACIQASGKLTAREDATGTLIVEMDATAAYRPQVPTLLNYQREIHCVQQRYFIVVDRLQLAQESDFEWLLHTLSPCTLTGQHFHYQGTRANLSSEFIYCSSGSLALTNHRSFSGVAEEETQKITPQWYMAARSQRSKHHTLVTLLIPSPQAECYAVVSRIEEGHIVFTTETEAAYCLPL